VRSAVFGMVVVLAACATSVRADAPAAPDSSIHGYLETLSDSTDARFGAVAAPADTAGLDSARVYALAHPESERSRRGRLALFPVADFNRVDGPVLGLGVALGTPDRRGRLKGEWAEATGPNLSLGSATYTKRLARGAALWQLKLYGGRSTPVMDREDQGHALSALAGFVSGADRSHFPACMVLSARGM